MGIKLAMCGASLIGLAWSTMAVAQDSDQPVASEGEGLQEIVVTAQRRAENLQSVPVAVSVLTGDSLAAGGISDTTDLQVAVPGLVAFQTANNFTPYIRGVGTNQTASGSEASVAIYIDGVYQGGKPGNVMELGSIERIEVLKGPQGTLYGRNATGGAINIVTRAPSHDPEIELDVGYGRFNEMRARAYASGAITDTLLASVSFTGRWSDGYIRDVFRDKDHAALKQTVGMGKLRWIPTDRLTADLSASYSYVDDPTFNSAHITPGTISTAAALGFLAPTGDNEAATSAQDPFSQVKTTRVSLNATYDFDQVRLVSISGYIDMEAFSFFDIDTSPANIQHLNVGQVGEQYSQELQLQSNGSGPLSWIVGAYYLRFDEGYGKRPKPYHLMVGLPYPYRPADLLVPGALAIGRSAIVETETGSAFFQGTYEFTPSTRFTAGLRYSIETKSLTGTQELYTAVPGNGGPGVILDAVELGNDGLVIGAIPAGTVDLKRKWKEPTWRLAVDHDFSDDVMGYVSYTRGFKSGSLNPGAITNLQVPVDPEIIDAYETGLKTELFDRLLRLNFSAFYYDYRNIQVSAVTPQGTSQTENAASARLYGLDVDMIARPTVELTLRGGVNLLDSKYKSYASAQATLPRVQGVTCIAPPRQITLEEAREIANGTPTGGNCAYSLDASGSDLIIAPKITANFGFDYEVPLASGSRVMLSSSIYYNDGFDTAPGGVLAHIGAFENLTASLTWYGRDDRYFVRLWGDNLTNDRHPEVILPLGVAFQEVSNKPTTYGLTLGFKLGS